MLTAVHTINILLPFLYAASFAVYVFDFFNEKSILRNGKQIFLLLTLLLHFSYLLLRTIQFEHAPITNKYEIFTILACAVLFSYFLLELISDIRGTGLFVILFSFVFQSVSSLFIEDLLIVPEPLRNSMLGTHVISVMIGYAALSIAAVHGVLYILFYRKLKSNNPTGLFFDRLPNLEVLEKLTFFSSLIGLAALSIAIVIGGVWLPQAFPNISVFDIKIITTVLVALFYLLALIFRRTAGWYGRRFIYLSLIGYGLALTSLLLTNVLGTSFHTFN